MPKPFHAIGVKFLDTMFDMHDLKCKFKSLAHRLNIMLEHLQRLSRLSSRSNSSSTIATSKINAIQASEAQIE